MAGLPCHMGGCGFAVQYKVQSISAQKLCVSELICAPETRKNEEASASCGYVVTPPVPQPEKN